jgi:hypothetical protein
MVTGAIAIMLGALTLAVVEGMGKFYPARTTWTRIRSRHGRRAARAMRVRLEATADRGTPRPLVVLLLVVAIAWVASASLLDKRWWEVVLDVLPYVFVGVAFLRVPPVLRKVADRMKGYERDAGEDPDRDLDDGDESGGAAEIAL